MSFYLKKLSKRQYFNVGSVINNTKRIKFMFNNQNFNNNFYPFQFNNNSVFLDDSVNILNNKEFNKEDLLKLIKGVDDKIEKIDNLAFFDLNESAKNAYFFKDINSSIDKNNSETEKNNKVKDLTNNELDSNNNSNNASLSLNTLENKDEKVETMNNNIPIIPLKYGFSIIINNHYKLILIYSTNIMIRKYFHHISTISRINNTTLNTIGQDNKFIKTKNMNDLNDNTQLLLFNELNKLSKNTTESNQEEYNKVTNDLYNLIKKFNEKLREIEKILSTKKLLINFRVKEKQDLRAKLLIFLSAVTGISFLILIYLIFSWDIIEPTTYLFGNILLILQLLYFLKFKKRIGVENFYSVSYYNNLIKSFSYEYGYSSLLHKEIKEELIKSNVCIQIITNLKLENEKNCNKNI